MIDQEPNRSVQIRRRVDTRLPSPLLSSIIPAPTPKPNLGGLGNLRATTTASTPAGLTSAPASASAAAWGKSIASVAATASAAVSANHTPASTPPISRTSSLQPLVGSRGKLPQSQTFSAHAHTHAVGLGSSSLLSAPATTPKSSRPATPVIPAVSAGTAPTPVAPAGTGTGAGTGMGQERKGTVGKVDDGDDWEEGSGDEA